MVFLIAGGRFIARIPAAAVLEKKLLKNPWPRLFR
jgi:hypothetical protein